MASNGTIVAYGDANRYILVLNGQTHEEIFSIGDLHKDKILDLFVTEDKIASVTHDMAYGLTSISG